MTDNSDAPTESLFIPREGTPLSDSYICFYGPLHFTQGVTGNAVFLHGCGTRLAGLDTLRNLSDLESLKLNGYDITEDDLRTIESLESLHELHLINCKLKRSPSRMCNEINLSNNNIRILPQMDFNLYYDLFDIRDNPINFQDEQTKIVLRNLTDHYFRVIITFNNKNYFLGLSYLAETERFFDKLTRLGGRKKSNKKIQKFKTKKSNKKCI